MIVADEICKKYFLSMQLRASKTLLQRPCMHEKCFPHCVFWSLLRSPRGWHALLRRVSQQPGQSLTCRVIRTEISSPGTQTCAPAVCRSESCFHFDSQGECAASRRLPAQANDAEIAGLLCDAPPPLPLVREDRTARDYCSEAFNNFDKEASWGLCTVQDRNCQAPWQHMRILPVPPATYYVVEV